MDIPLLANIPNLTYLAPVNKEEYLAMLDWSIDQKEKPVAIRVPWTGVKHSDYDVAEEYDKVSYMVMQKRGRMYVSLHLADFMSWVLRRRH